MAVEVLWISACKNKTSLGYVPNRRRWIGRAKNECGERAEALTCAHLSGPAGCAHNLCDTK